MKTSMEKMTKEYKRKILCTIVRIIIETCT